MFVWQERDEAEKIFGAGKADVADAAEKADADKTFEPGVATEVIIMPGILCLVSSCTMGHSPDSKVLTTRDVQ